MPSMHTFGFFHLRHLSQHVRHFLPSPMFSISFWPGPTKARRNKNVRILKCTICDIIVLYIYFTFFRFVCLGIGGGLSWATGDDRRPASERKERNAMRTMFHALNYSYFARYKCFRLAWTLVRRPASDWVNADDGLRSSCMKKPIRSPCKITNINFSVFFFPLLCVIWAWYYLNRPFLNGFSFQFFFFSFFYLHLSTFRFHSNRLLHIFA